MQFSITSRCNRTCHWCSLGTAYNEFKHDNDFDYLEKYSKYFQDMEEVVITGGEPTIHKQFYKYIKTFIKLYRPKTLILQTDGFKIKGNEKAFELFDQVNVSHYSSKTYEGCKDNEKLCQYIQTIVPEEKLTIGDVVHVQFPDMTGRDQACERLDIGPVLFEGRLYSCCAGPGLDTDTCIEVTDNWKKEIQKCGQLCVICPWARKKRWEKWGD
ncbi:MAG: radical SAM protein [Desulfobacterales bacterium]|nr:radical SAM protein [Desulfobacterales bacterium]